MGKQKQKTVAEPIVEMDEDLTELSEGAEEEEDLDEDEDEVPAATGAVPKMGKRKFVNRQPLAMTDAEIVVAAAALGMKLTVARVAKIRAKRNVSPKAALVHRLTNATQFIGYAMSALNMSPRRHADIADLHAQLVESANALPLDWKPAVAAAIHNGTLLSVGDVVDLTTSRAEDMKELLGDDVVGLTIVKIAGKRAVAATQSGIHLFLPIAHFVKAAPAAEAEVG